MMTTTQKKYVKCWESVRGPVGVQEWEWIKIAGWFKDDVNTCQR